MTRIIFYLTRSPSFIRGNTKLEEDLKKKFQKHFERAKKKLILKNRIKLILIQSYFYLFMNSVVKSCNLFICPLYFFWRGRYRGGGMT